jgi:glycosyltransferase involved in cell wall biosynthesis
VSSRLELQALGTTTEIVHTLFAVCAWLDENRAGQVLLQVPPDEWGWASRVREPRLRVTVSPVHASIHLAPSEATNDTPLAEVFAKQIGAQHLPPRAPRVYTDMSAVDPGRRGCTVLATHGLPPPVQARIEAHYRDHKPLHYLAGDPLLDGELLDVIATSRLVVAGENRVLDLALLLQRPVIGLFSRGSAHRRLGVGNLWEGLTPGCPGYPCGDTVCCEGPGVGVFQCADDITPHHLAQAKPSNGPSVTVRQPATDILAVLPFLSAGGGERSTLAALRGIQSAHPSTRLAAVVCGGNSSEGHFRPLFSDLLQADLSGRSEQVAGKLSHLLLALQPRSILFYNNGAVVLALMGMAWRPERCAFVVHTVMARDEYALLNDPLADSIVSHVIAVSERTADHIRSNGYRLAPKVRAIRNATEPLVRGGGDSIRQKLRIAEDAFVVGYLGRMDEAKGVGAVIQASHDRSRGVIYLMVGWGDLYQKAVRSAHAGLLVAPATPYVAPWLSTMDLLVLPTHTEGGTPYVLMEALSVGTPVAITPVADVPSLFRHKESILTIDTTPASVASAVRWAVAHREELTQIAARGGEIVRRELSIERMAEAYYEVLLGGLPQ